MKTQKLGVQTRRGQVEKLLPSCFCEKLVPPATLLQKCNEVGNNTKIITYDENKQELFSIYTFI